MTGSNGLRRGSGQARGFSFVELVVSMAITLTVLSSMFGIINSARSIFEVDLERTDMHQRARVSADALFKDVVMAGAGLQVPAIAPFRRGERNADIAGAAFPDRISVLYLPPGTPADDVVINTYALRVDGAGVPQLTRYDGRDTELPVVDQVTSLRFEYFDAAGQPIELARFSDGPWVPNAVAADRFDGDLLTIQRVRTIVRVRPARLFAGMPLDDFELTVDIAPRNMSVP
jgi:hypothetical protein